MSMTATLLKTWQDLLGWNEAGRNPFSRASSHYSREIAAMNARNQASLRYVHLMLPCLRMPVN